MMIVVSTVWPFATNYFGESTTVMFIALAAVLLLNGWLVKRDAEQFDGSQRVSRWFLLFTPLYLLLRDIKRKAFPYWGIASCLLLAAAMYQAQAIGYLTANEPVVCNLVTKIIADADATESLGECKSVRMGKKIAEDVYEGQAVTTKSGVLQLVVTFDKKTNQLYTRVTGGF